MSRGQSEQAVSPSTELYFPDLQDSHPVLTYPDLYDPAVHITQFSPSRAYPGPHRQSDIELLPGSVLLLFEGQSTQEVALISG